MNGLSLKALIALRMLKDLIAALMPMDLIGVWMRPLRPRIRLKDEPKE
jgi:hypothetical protein